jgi:hypothetical protein
MNSTRYFKKISTSNFKGLEALDEHISIELIDTTCIIELEGAPPVFYLNEKHPELGAIAKIIDQIRFNSSERSANKGKDSILFGAVNRAIGKIGSCTQGALHSRSPELDQELCTTFATVHDSLLNEFLPSWHKIGKIRVDQKPILDEYKMLDTNFTSGIINRNSSFRYHFDDFNLRNTYSSMIVYKKKVSGGFLVFPEYGIGFKLDDQSIIQFYGKKILHGVTPIQKHADDAHRISVVYYTSKDLDKCLTYEDELKRVQNI